MPIYESPLDSKKTSNAISEFGPNLTNHQAHMSLLLNQNGFGVQITGNMHPLMEHTK